MYFMEIFIVAHEDYDYKKLSMELENIWKHEGEFHINSLLIFHGFVMDFFLIYI